MGRTPLMTAIELKHVEIAKLLIESGADVNIRDNSGISPIMVAEDYLLEDVVKLLLKYGADTDGIQHLYDNK